MIATLYIKHAQGCHETVQKTEEEGMEVETALLNRPLNPH